ncbi:ISNCY family transposase [Candidatus Hakubella thermalkaliphila]|uniref:Integrase catalytic domain-containing protein n=1 Tax=Candidatus Hakubella thermalkaliphila TaxID=2754717 RepID=A0A6V8P7J1_9ACTN|nr:ISNCY family transposase [Candidatus Hakubella thermalkaliphila]GFP27970.1 hypothetical protein HKBW3S33_01381 [Candidatus Hakubella thermalkaliphila]
MKEQKVWVTMKDIQRYKVLKDVLDKRLKGIEAAQLLNLTPIHISRLKTRLLKRGFEALLRRTPPSPPNKRINDSLTKEILKLLQDFYYDFNILHFKDKLGENHDLQLSYESLRQILIKAGEPNPKKKKKVHRQRRRMPKAGMLVQRDSSQHQWLKHIPEKWWLVAMIDDATNEVPYARFFPKDTLFANMHVLRRFIEIKDLFMSLYVDKASHFKTTRHGGLPVEVGPEQDDTQIERALEELGITLIPANSPQAKGRRFRLFQDRLIKEMRLAGIKDYEEANKFLQDKFLLWHNQRYMLEAESSYMPLPQEKNLDLIFGIKKERTVNHDDTLSFNGQIIQIPPSTIRLSFAKARVEVCLLEDNRIFVLHKGKVIAESILSKDSKTIKKEKKIEELLNQREYQPKILPVRNEPPKKISTPLQIIPGGSPSGSGTDKSMWG